MKKYEQTFCTRLGRWYDAIGYKLLPVFYFPIEAKISIGNKPFNYKTGIKEHQIPTLLQYKSKAMYWKISDLDSTSAKHYDLHFSHPVVCFPLIAIMWIRRGNKVFYLIEPQVIQGRIDDGHKSLKEEEAELLCYYKGKLANIK